MKTTQATTANHGLKAGDILAASWGYDQTNWDFYEVTRATAKTVTVRELQTAKTDDPNLDMQGDITPRLGQYTNGMAAFRRKVEVWDGEAIVGISSYERARLWDGQPKHFTSYA
jgi:hypothetical protein